MVDYVNDRKLHDNNTKKNYILYTDNDFIENLVCIPLLMSQGIFITKKDLLEGKQPYVKQFL